MSGYSEHAALPPNLCDRGVAVLQKPFDLLTLARQVRQVLDRPRSTDN